MKKEMAVKEVKEVKEVKKDCVVVFGYEVENKKYNIDEIFGLIKNNFDSNNLEVGKISYFILGLRYRKLIDLSYNVINELVIKIMESNGYSTNSSVNCLSFYMRKIKSGERNINEKFKNNGRVRSENIDLSKYNFKF